VSYLLDTNACIALINGNPTSVRARFEKVASSKAEIYVSSISTYELWYGVYKSSREEFNRKRLQAFLNGPLIVIPFEDDDAQSAGLVRSGLEASGKPIGAYDILIAGHALHRKLTLVTANTSEFSRVKNLVCEDWAK